MSMYKKKREKFAEKLITPPLPLFAEDFPLLFFWSPKSGCTSLIKWYFFQIHLLQKAIDYHPWIHFYRMDIYETQENYKLTITKQLLHYKKEAYKLVRNPYSRAVSSFFATLTNKEITDQVFPTGIENGLSFKQFLYQVKDIGVTRELINSHIAQQYVVEEELFIENHVHLEQFIPEIKALEKKYNLLDSPMDMIIKSSHHNAPNVSNSGKHTLADVKMSMETIFNAPLPQYKTFYDQETKDLVNELFKQDFEKYHYKQNDLSI